MTQSKRDLTVVNITSKTHTIKGTYMYPYVELLAIIVVVKYFDVWMIGPII